MLLIKCFGKKCWETIKTNGYIMNRGPKDCRTILRASVLDWWILDWEGRLSSRGLTAVVPGVRCQIATAFALFAGSPVAPGTDDPVAPAPIFQVKQP